MTGDTVMTSDFMKRVPVKMSLLNKYRLLKNKFYYGIKMKSNKTVIMKTRMMK